MKYNLMMNLVGSVLNSINKKDLSKSARKSIKKEYKNIILQAKDIGSSNNLLSSYLLAAYFIGMNKADHLTPEVNINILEHNMRNSKALKAFLGDSKGYFNEKKMAFRREWSRRTHERRWENDWVVDIVEKNTPLASATENNDKDFRFGFNYMECGVCKLCKDMGCPELAKYLCSLDFMLVELIGIKLKRTKTLAEGGDFCDFRFYKG